MRSKDVADGQQVEIPALQYNRTVGTYVESTGAEWKAARKRESRKGGKPPLQGRFANLTPHDLAPVFALPANALCMRPHISDDP